MKNGLLSHQHQLTLDFIIAKMQANTLWHASTDSKTVLCFNPACSAACNRIFIPSEGPRYHLVCCDKWFVQAPDVVRLQNPPKVEAFTEREKAVFFKAPIAATIKFFERRDSIRAKIVSMYEDLKVSIIGCIESSKNAKLQELEFMSKQLENFRSIILEGASLAECQKGKNSQEQRKMASIAISSLIKSPKFYVPAFRDIQFFNIGSFQEMSAKLKSQIQNLGSCILKESEIEGAFEGLQYEDMINVELMLQRKSQKEQYSKNNKEKEKYFEPDPLTTLVSWQESDYFTEKSKRITEIGCPLCRFKFEANWVFSVGQPKSAYYDVIVKHLLSDHLLFLGLCFSHRISRNSIKELPVSEVIYLTQKYNYDQLDIFDAANTKGLRYEPNPRCLTILMAPENLKTEEFDYAYCIANSPEEAAYKITLLIEEVANKLGKTIRLFNFKRNYYNLFSTIVSKQCLNVQLEEKYQSNMKGCKIQKK